MPIQSQNRVGDEDGSASEELMMLFTSVRELARRILLVFSSRTTKAAHSNPMAMLSVSLLPPWVSSSELELLGAALRTECVAIASGTLTSFWQWKWKKNKRSQSLMHSEIGSTCEKRHRRGLGVYQIKLSPPRAFRRLCSKGFHLSSSSAKRAVALSNLPFSISK
jgi:hypothetical protein